VISVYPEFLLENDRNSNGKLRESLKLRQPKRAMSTSGTQLRRFLAE